jgi:hypothetical protein
MFKWFAPLLLFAGKPEMLLRIAVAAIVGAVLFFGVWLISNIAVTFDTLKNPFIIAIYGVVLLCFFIIVGSVSWLRLRRLSSPAAKLSLPGKAPEIPLPTAIVTKRAAEISRQWELGKQPAPAPRKQAVTPPPAAVSAEPARVRLPARATLTVTGPAYSGKTALIDSLAQTSVNVADAADTILLDDAGPIDANERHLAAVVAKAAASDGILFVVDQDLRAPEVAAIKRLMATAKPLYVVLNKADQFSASDRDTIMVSIRSKMPAGFSPANAVSVTVAPSAVEREIHDARGAVRIELRKPSPDLRALTNLLTHQFPPRAGQQQLHFEADASSGPRRI